MENRIDYLFLEWHYLGGEVLLARIEKIPSIRPLEEVIGESTAYCRDSGRLTWIILDWLTRHINQVNEDKLLEETKKQGDLSVLGLLCDLANNKTLNPKFKKIIENCQPENNVQIFFNRVAKSPLATRITKENALEQFRKWNYLCSELRYLH
jgi:hypothetical protein